MGVNILIEKQRSETLEAVIKTCKSDSGVCGKKLRDAHFLAGTLLGEEILNNYDEKSYAVIIMMRAGLPFGLGIADSLEHEKTVRVFFYCDGQILSDSLNTKDFDKIIIVDAVIRTGQAMLDLTERLVVREKIILATNVIDERSITNFTGLQVFAVRSSKHSYIGSDQKYIENGKGPDTGDRLFRSDFLTA